MTADEAISIFDEIMRPYLPDQGAAFRARAMEDVTLLRRQTDSDVRVELDKDRPRVLPFHVPDRYGEDGELFVVFLAFVSYFLDPVVCASETANLFQKLAPKSEIAGIAVVADSELQREGETIYDELEIADSERLNMDVSEMTAAVQSIGYEMFGDRFALADFTGTERA